MTDQTFVATEVPVKGVLPPPACEAAPVKQSATRVQLQTVLVTADKPLDLH